MYPPILAGDFNLGTTAISERLSGGFSRFSVLHWSPEVMGVLIGKDDEWPSAQKVIVRGARDLPDFGCMPGTDPRFSPVPSNPLTLWSDHCASIYFRIVPVLDRPS